MNANRMNEKMMKLIAAATAGNDGTAPPGRILPAVRIPVALTEILLCALAVNALFVVTVVAMELVRAMSLKPAQLVKVTITVLSATGMTMLLMLPAVFLGSPHSMLTVGLRVFESVLVVANMNALMDWRQLTGALRSARVPEVFVLFLDMTIRFMAILSRYSGMILEAVRLRTVSRLNWKNAPTGGTLGTTFLKSRKIAGQTAEAMQCRCFDGRYPTMEKRKFGFADFGCLLLIPALAAYFIYCESLM